MHQISNPQSQISNMPNRRDFILQACGTCAAVAGLGFLVAQLDSCKSPEGLKADAAKTNAIKAEVTKSQITVPANAFADQNNFLVKDISLDFDVLVVKKPDGSYSALQMRCTHRGQPLRATPTELICDSHGSAFDLNGNVTKAPASSPLKKYPATVENGKVVVKLDA